MKIFGDGSSRIISGDSTFIGSLASGDSVQVTATVEFYEPVESNRVKKSTNTSSAFGWSSISILPSNNNGLSVSTINSYGYQISCCIGIRGNVDGDILDEIDISDLVILSAYSFQNGTEPPCMEEADIDGSGGSVPIDISDIVLLVAYMFQGGAAPALCQ